MARSHPRRGNPCRRLKKHTQRRRERYLSAQELARVGGALAEAERDASERAAAILAIRLLLVTGCRKSEILGLRWEDVDLAAPFLSRLLLPLATLDGHHAGCPGVKVGEAAERSEGNLDAWASRRW